MKKIINVSIIALMFVLSMSLISWAEQHQKQTDSSKDSKKDSAAHGKTQPLFIIERNKNANEVHYDAQLTSDGKLDTDEPVIAYWIMKAEDGRREQLSDMEKEKAYGFDVKPSPAADSYKMTLKADPP